MRRAIFIAALLCGQPALANDFGPTDWTGAYFGAFGGLGVSSGRATLNSFSGVLLPLDVEYGLFPQRIQGFKAGGALGVAAGVNFQSGAFVGGIEGDIGYTWARSHQFYSRIDNVPSSPFPGVSTNTSYETNFGAIGTLRARGGYAFGNTLVFGTVGVAAGHVHNRFELRLPDAAPGFSYVSPEWSGSGMRLGYAVGVGVEHRLTDKVGIKFETLYVDLADRVVHGSDPVNFPGEAISYRFSNSVILPRLSITLRF